MTAVAVFASLLVFIWLKLPRLRAQSKSISIEIDLELESKHAPFMASRRRLEEFVRADEHKGWRSLVEVDGLKNSEVVMFVTSTTNGNNHFLWDRIIPSARTWMRLFAQVYVVIEDNFLIRYALRHCARREFPSYTVFSCKNEPHYLLSRTCTNEYYNAKGICCKIDDAINFLVSENTELFERIKYMVEGDDDTFFRPNQVLRWLAAVDRCGISEEFALVANGDLSAHDPNEPHTGKIHVDHGGIWHIKGCSDIHGNGWYQPMMLNKRALERLRVSSKAFGFTKTCEAFHVSQDVGFGPYAWMMELKHIHMPGVEINTGHRGQSIFREHLMAVHDVKHHPSDLCDKPEHWPDDMRYKQDLVVGCGNLTHRGPFHNASAHEADMYDAWEYYQQHGVNISVGVADKNDWYNASVTLYSAPDLDGSTKERINRVINLSADTLQDHDNEGNTAYRGAKYYEGNLVHYRVIPYIYDMPGFSSTKFAKHHDLTKQWETFHPTDCTDPGSF